MRSALPASGRFQAVLIQINDRALGPSCDRRQNYNETARLRTWRTGPPITLQIVSMVRFWRSSLEADRMNTLMSRTRPNCLAVLFGLASILTPVRAQQARRPRARRNKPVAAPRALVQPEAEPKLPHSRPSGKTYALLIGISRYKQDPPVTSLQFADKDAETFCHASSDAHRGPARESGSNPSADR